MQSFNDQPAVYRDNLNTELPMDRRAPGSVRPMSEQDMADLVCFLNTLTNGLDPAATPASTTCVN